MAHLELLDALKNLANEVSGILGAYEPEMRDWMGKMNVDVLIRREREARAAIAKAESGE